LVNNLVTTLTLFLYTCTSLGEWEWFKHEVQYFVAFLVDKKQNIFSRKQKGFRDGLSYSTPQKKLNKGNAIPSLGPIPLKNVEFRDGMGPRLGNGISPCFFNFFRGGVYQYWGCCPHLSVAKMTSISKEK